MSYNNLLTSIDTSKRTLITRDVVRLTMDDILRILFDVNVKKFHIYSFGG